MVSVTGPAVRLFALSALLFLLAVIVGSRAFGATLTPAEIRDRQTVDGLTAYISHLAC